MIRVHLRAVSTATGWLLFPAQEPMWNKLIPEVAPPGCRVGAELELRCGAIIERLSVTTCVLADLAGASKPDAFWSLKGECEVLRKDIRDLREQIASHRSEHHC